MSRYTGPKHKLARREGVNILDKTSQSLQRRLNIPPGIHGRKGRKRISEYGTQLREKQKAKAVYGILEKQLRRLVRDVQRKKGDTAELLLQLLETRLDSIVYRLGFAKTRFQARQFVGHGHILVNGKKVNIPSYQLQEADVVSISEHMTKNPTVVKLFEEKPTILGFLKRDKAKGILIRMPNKSDLNPLFDTQLIIEYYSR